MQITPLKTTLWFLRSNCNVCVYVYSPLSVCLHMLCLVPPSSYLERNFIGRAYWWLSVGDCHWIVHLTAWWGHNGHSMLTLLATLKVPPHKYEEATSHSISCRLEMNVFCVTKFCVSVCFWMRNVSLQKSNYANKYPLQCPSVQSDLRSNKTISASLPVCPMAYWRSDKPTAIPQ